MCVGPQHAAIAAMAIRSLHLFERPPQLFVIANATVYAEIATRVPPEVPIVLIEEDSLADVGSLADMKTYFVTRCGNSRRAPWYFQQFLKMAFARRGDAARRYLIWDSDTVLLRRIEFIDEAGRVLINPRSEFHAPYFKVIADFFGHGRQVNFSFISEHMMVDKQTMASLLSEIETIAGTARAWPYAILDRIETAHLYGSGFSEYECYGSYIASRIPESWRVRPLRVLRHGAMLFGQDPKADALVALMRAGFDTVTFEAWDRKLPALVGVIGALLKAYGFGYRVLGLEQTERDRGRRRFAANICG
jgi:hypothetical protein